MRAFLARDRGRRARAVALVLGLASSSCYIETQRFPAPMPGVVDPLPAGTLDAFPPGPEEVIIVRHADPVQVRNPGQAGSFPLRFHSKQIRVNSGAWVFCGASGRTELIFSDDSNIVLFGLGSGALGSRSRDEPIFLFQECTRASISFGEPGQVQLLGGAVLSSGDGPFVIERPAQNVLRVRNRSKGFGNVLYREDEIVLDPGQVVDLPLLEVGTHPIVKDPDFQTMTVGGARIELTGGLEPVPDPRGVRLRATGDHEVRGMGLVLRLDPGDEVHFDDLSRVTARHSGTSKEPESTDSGAAEPSPAEGGAPDPGPSTGSTPEEGP